jgi:hypothetical protein
MMSAGTAQHQQRPIESRRQGPRADAHERYTPSASNVRTGPREVQAARQACRDGKRISPVRLASGRTAVYGQESPPDE